MSILKSNFDEVPALVPPPSYLESTQHEHGRKASTLSTGPQHMGSLFSIWKRILILFLCQVEDDEQQAENLVHLVQNVRLVSRVVYAATMSLLRARYFASYRRYIKLPIYSTNLDARTLDWPCRETRVLDHYITFQVNRRLDALQSSLLLNNDDSASDQSQVLRDLFSWLQPQTYLEDEIHKSLADQDPVQFRHVLVRFHFTSAAITLPCRIESSSSQTPAIFRKECVQISRPRDEPMFVTADRLVQRLHTYVFVRKMQGQKVWYELIGQHPT